VACVLLQLVAVRTAAQPLARASRPAPAASSPLVLDGGTHDLSVWPQERPIAPGVAFLASAAVPGAGQFLQGADRWFGYAVIEVWSILSWLDHRADGRAFERSYRDLAWSTARRASDPPRRDSVFEYYEDMTRFTASGAFDRDAREPGIQPELDRETFNGELWLLARELYTSDAEALAYYASRAIVPTYAWAWGDSNLERQAFVETIRESDEAYRHATTALGVLLANHMVSAVDALVLARLQAAGSEPRRLRLHSGLTPGPRGPRWSAAVFLHF
jgi:hypothetical protein